jgi:hypothetical protein
VREVGLGRGEEGGSKGAGWTGGAAAVTTATKVLAVGVGEFKPTGMEGPGGCGRVYGYRRKLAPPEAETQPQEGCSGVRRLLACVGGRVNEEFAH